MAATGTSTSSPMPRPRPPIASCSASTAPARSPRREPRSGGGHRSDGIKLELLANVNGPADAEMAVRTGASGVGLYRTEYLFLTHPTRARRGRAIRRLQGRHRGGAQSQPSPSARSTSAATSSCPTSATSARPIRSWAGAASASARPTRSSSRRSSAPSCGPAVHGKVELLFPMISTLEEVRTIKTHGRATTGRI